MAKELYERRKWRVDNDHRWLIRAANNSRRNLYGACPNVEVIIEDVVNVQFFCAIKLYICYYSWTTSYYGNTEGDKGYG